MVEKNRMLGRSGQRLSWMDGVKIALGRGIAVEAAEQCVMNRKDAKSANAFVGA